MDKNTLSIMRSDQLHKMGENLETQLNMISSGMEPEQICAVDLQQASIMKHLSADSANWDNWQWQLENRIQDVKELAALLEFTPKQLSEVKTAAEHYRFAISPYYLSLIQKSIPLKNIGAMSIPTALELVDGGCFDPSAEECNNPEGNIVRRYPNRAIINITNCCASYCRHCQRKRNIGAADQMITAKNLEASIQYIKTNTEIHDVLITGGDALTLSDEQLDVLLSTLREIPHVEIIRLGSRMPVNLPQRITETLVNVLKKYAPIYLNTQFNHPLEITPASSLACGRLADSGIILGNQMVLLKEINDDKYIVHKLNQMLLKLRVRPYYMFHAKNVIGAMHFQTSVEKGIEILEHLNGNASGLAIPRYIISAPEGLGKIQISPDTIFREDDGTFELNTWEGIPVSIRNIQ